MAHLVREFSDVMLDLWTTHFDDNVLIFLQDFATPSLTEENTVFSTDDDAELERREIEQFQLRRSWENR